MFFWADVPIGIVQGGLTAVSNYSLRSLKYCLWHPPSNGAGLDSFEFDPFSVMIRASIIATTSIPAQKAETRAFLPVHMCRQFLLL